MLSLYPKLTLQIKPGLHLKFYCEEFYKQLYFEELYINRKYSVGECLLSIGPVLEGHMGKKSGNQEQYSKQYISNHTCINAKLVKEQKDIWVKV